MMTRSCEIHLRACGCGAFAGSLFFSKVKNTRQGGNWTSSYEPSLFVDGSENRQLPKAYAVVFKYDG